MSTVLALLLAGISYDNEIRGVLVVVVAVGVLMGSVYLILSTNLGGRLGFQVLLAALLGWMTLLSLFWWIYGKGNVGELPEWRVEEINIGDIQNAQLEDARVLLPEDLPDAEQILADHPEVADAFDEGEVPTLSEIAAVTDLPDEVADQLKDLPGDWIVLPASELGDPQTAADTALTNPDTGLPFESTTDYVVVGGFTEGGKPDRESDSVWDRVTNRISNVVHVFNPPHYVVLQVQPSEVTEVPAGGTPLSPTPDPDSPVISVILIRDLGSIRLPPAMLTISFGLLFALVAWRLHDRDLRARELNSQTAGEG